VIRVFVLYEEEPDAERYRQHVELCQKVEGATFRHGAVFGSPTGKSSFAHYAEFEFPDLETFKAVTRTPEFAETGVDAQAMGIPFQAHFADIS
jgi:hypothetical protein